ncbi:MAG: GntR family transcriptional regulator [Oscillospiraceae bacterium]|nr:GntR family transcriptional regulator [Oscillospiraceae bacterium]
MDFRRIYKTQSLSEMAVQYIKNKILSGEFKGGDKLIETNISADLAISRPPVREALRELSVQGMIVFSPRKGNVVPEISLEEILEIFDIRISLEVKVLELLIQKKLLAGEDFACLRSLVEKMRAQSSLEGEPHEKMYQLNSLDLQFHSYLWAASKSFRRAKIMESLFFQLLLAMNRTPESLGVFGEKAIEHERIVDALEKNDLDLAVSQFTVHLDSYTQAIVKGMRVR